MAKIVKNEDYKKRIDLKDKLELEDHSSLFAIDEPSGVVSKQVFETQGKAKAILEDAKQQASQIRQDAKLMLSQVQDEAEKARQAGQARGYQEGLSNALTYLHQIHALREKMFEDAQGQIVKLVFSIAEKVIGEQVHQNEAAILNIVKQAVDAAIGSKIVVRVNPKDMQKIKENEALLLSHVSVSKSISFKDDDLVKVGGCVVESEVGKVDAQLDTQLMAIKKALGL